MSHSYNCCLVHVVFSTAERRPLIKDEFRTRLHAYMGGIARENGIVAITIGGVADHVHLLLSLPRTISIAKAVQLIKAGSSKWVNENFPRLGRFSWQEGFGSFSIGISQQERTIAYIQNQEQHHKRISFEDEFKKFLEMHGLSLDELSRPAKAGL